MPPPQAWRHVHSGALRADRTRPSRGRPAISRLSYCEAGRRSVPEARSVSCHIAIGSRAVRGAVPGSPCGESDSDTGLDRARNARRVKAGPSIPKARDLAPSDRQRQERPSCRVSRVLPGGDDASHDVRTGPGLASGAMSGSWLSCRVHAETISRMAEIVVSSFQMVELPDGGSTPQCRHPV